MNNIWTLYQVEWQFLGKLCASVPGDQELIKKWLEGRKPGAIPPAARSITEIQEEVFSTLAEEAQAETEDRKNLLIFQRVEGKLVVRAGTLRAHIKDCARVLSAQYVGKVKGERSFATRIINGVYHDEQEYWIPLRNEQGEQVSSPSGIHEKAVRFRLPTGQQVSALKAFEYVEKARLTFTLKVLGKSVSREDLETLFTYGGVHGYGGERGDGEGRYKFTVEETCRNERQQSSR